MGKNPPFVTLQAIINPFRDEIDRSLRREGYSDEQYQRFTPWRVNRLRARGRGFQRATGRTSMRGRPPRQNRPISTIRQITTFQSPNYKNFRTYNNPTRGFRSLTRGFRSRTFMRGRPPNQSNPQFSRSRSISRQPFNRNQQNNRGRSFSRQSRGRRSVSINTFQRGRRDESQKQLFCSMCGSSYHGAESCTNMIQDNGRKLNNIAPNYSICEKCPQNVKRKLHHPEHLCIFRKEVKQHISPKLLAYNQRV